MSAHEDGAPAAREADVPAAYSPTDGVGAAREGAPRRDGKAEARARRKLERTLRDAPIVAEVMRQVDRGHPARAELALDAVAVGEGAAEPLESTHP